jgi:hypothetical protein
LLFLAEPEPFPLPKEEFAATSGVPEAPGFPEGVAAKVPRRFPAGISAGA